MTDLREHIREKYFSSSGLWGAQKFAKKFGFPLKTVKEELAKYEVVQRTKEERQVTKAAHSHKIFSHPKKNGVSYGAQIDFYDFAGHSKRKKALQGGYRYVLAIIDTFSRKVWLFPTKTKGGACIQIMEEFFRANPFRHLTGDRESIWYRSKRWKAFCKKKDLTMHYTEVWGAKDMRCAYVERFFKTMKGLLDKLQIIHSSKRVFRFIPDIEKNYNESPHRSLGWHTPNFTWSGNISVEVQKDRETVTRFEIGEHVRIRETKTIFQKKSDPHWSKEIYTIIDKQGLRYKLETNKKIFPHLVRAGDMQKISESFNPRRSGRGRAVDDMPYQLQALPEEQNPIPKVKAPPFEPRRTSRKYRRVNYAE